MRAAQLEADSSDKSLQSLLVTRCVCHSYRVLAIGKTDPFFFRDSHLHETTKGLTSQSNIKTALPAFDFSSAKDLSQVLSFSDRFRITMHRGFVNYNTNWNMAESSNETRNTGPLLTSLSLTPTSIGQSNIFITGGRGVVWKIKRNEKMVDTVGVGKSWFTDWHM